MRIHCPYCGARSYEEFAYIGDARPQRPDASAPDSEQAFADYVYLRDNPCGALRELWFHAQGCHAWLVVERDTASHEILQVQPAGATSARSAGR